MASQQLNGPHPKVVIPNNRPNAKKMPFNQTQDEYEESKMIVPPYLCDESSFSKKSQNNTISSKQTKKSSKKAQKGQILKFVQPSQLRPRSMSQDQITFKKEQDLKNFRSALVYQQQEDEQFDYENFDDLDSQQFDLVDEDEDGYEDILNTEYQMIGLISFIQNNYQQLVEDEHILNKNTAYDQGTLRFIMVQYRYFSILNSFDYNGEFDIVDFIERTRSQSNLYNFLVDQYPSLVDQQNYHEQIFQYDYMTQQSFEQYFNYMISQQTISKITQDCYSEFDKDSQNQYLSQRISPYLKYESRNQQSDKGPLDNALKNEFLFDNIQKFNKDNKQNESKMSKKQGKKHDISIRRDKQNPTKQNKKSNQIQLFNLPQISIKNSNQFNQQDKNPCNLTYPQFIQLLQKQKQKAQQSKNQHSPPEQNIKSHFDLILGRQQNHISKDYLKPFIGEFSTNLNKEQDNFFHELNKSNIETFRPVNMIGGTFKNQIVNKSFTHNSDIQTQKDSQIMNKSCCIPFSKQENLFERKSTDLQSNQLTPNEYQDSSQINNFPKNNIILSTNRQLEGQKNQNFPQAFKLNNQTSSSEKISQNNKFSNQNKFIPNRCSINSFNSSQNQEVLSTNRTTNENNAKNSTPSGNSFEKNAPFSLNPTKFTQNLNSSSPQTPNFNNSQSLNFTNVLSQNPFSPISNEKTKVSQTQTKPVLLSFMKQNQQSQPSIPFGINKQTVFTNQQSNFIPMPINYNFSSIKDQNSFTTLSNLIPNSHTIPINSGLTNATILFQQNRNIGYASNEQNKGIRELFALSNKQKLTQMTPQKQPMQQLNQPSKNIQQKLVNKKQIQQKKVTNKICRNIYDEKQIMGMKVKDFIQQFCFNQMSLLYKDIFDEVLLMTKWEILDFNVNKQFCDKIKLMQQFLHHLNINQQKQDRKFNKSIAYNFKNKNQRQNLKTIIIEQPYLLMKYVDEILKTVLHESSTLQQVHDQSKINDNEMNLQKIINKRITKQNQMQILTDQTQKIQKIQAQLSEKLTGFEEKLNLVIKVQKNSQQVDKYYLTMNEQLLSMIKAIKNTEKWLIQSQLCTIQSTDKYNSNLSAQILLRTQNIKQNQTAEFKTFKLLYNSIEQIESNLQIMDQQLSFIH